MSETADNAAAPASDYLRRSLVLVAALAAPLIGYGQMAMDVGMTPQAFAAQGDGTLRIAPFTFTIWAVIYAWLLVYAVYQILPSTRDNAALKRLGWPSFVSLTGIGLWVMASAADWEWATVVIIVGSLLAILLPLIRNAARLRASPRRQQALVAWPLTLLAGWLTIASIANLLTVMTSQGWITPEAGPTVALGAIALAVVVALTITARLRLWPYPLPIAWGLIGAFVAARADGEPTQANAALAGAIVILIGSVAILIRRDKV